MLLICAICNYGFVLSISCHALSDLLQGRQLDGCISQLPKMWELVFRARDDIKVGFVMNNGG